MCWFNDSSGDALVNVVRSAKGSFCGDSDGVQNMSVGNDGESMVVDGIFRSVCVMTVESGS